MRFFLVLVSLVSLFSFSGTGRAYTYDDSVVIEIGDGVPNQAGTNSSASDTTQGGAGSGTDTSAGNSSSANSGGSNGSGSTNTTSGVSPLGSSGNGPITPVNTFPGSNTDVESALFDVLTTSGAITEGGGSLNGFGQDSSDSSSATNPDTVGSGNISGGGSYSGSGSGGGSAGASGGAGGGSGTITIDGAKVREALLGKLSFKDILEDHSARVRRGFYGHALSERDIGLMAASTMLGDSNIEQVSFGATRFEIVYRSQGYLLGFIPKSFPVHIEVNPQAVGFQQRVRIALPWYRFILRRLFDTAMLAQEIDTAIKTEGLPHEAESAMEIRARLFDAVSLIIKKKVGTLDLPAQQAY